MTTTTKRCRECVGAAKEERCREVFIPHLSASRNEDMAYVSKTVHCNYRFFLLVGGLVSCKTWSWCILRASGRWGWNWSGWTAYARACPHPSIHFNPTHPLAFSLTLAHLLILLVLFLLLPLLGPNTLVCRILLSLLFVFKYPGFCWAGGTSVGLLHPPPLSSLFHTT